MITDETLYEEGQLVAKDITIKSYFPLEKGQLVIDLDVYYDGLCCFEVVAVESRMSMKTEGIFITYDKRRIIYKTFDAEKAWTDEFELWSNVGATDTVQYVIRDVNTGQTSTGSIIIERIEHGAFKAQDVCVSIPVDSFSMEGWFGFPPMQMDLAWVNKQDSVKIIEVGDYNEKIFKSVAINIDKQSELVVEFASGCTNFNVGRTTEIEYAIEAEVNGEKSVSKAKVIFDFFTKSFQAEFIELSVGNPTPSDQYINVLDYNQTFANVGLLDVDTNTPSERGTVFIDHPMNTVRYQFNLESGYWDNPEAADMIQYKLINHNSGQEACSYITLEKKEADSGSGSGSGVASSNTYFVESSPANLLSIGNIMPLPEPDSLEADFYSLSNILLEGVVGENQLSGGRVHAQLIGRDATDTFDIGVLTLLNAPSDTSAAGVTLLNDVAPVVYMRLFAQVSSEPEENWSVQLLAFNPLSPSERSEIAVK